jgi:hypothetical protein
MKMVSNKKVIFKMEYFKSINQHIRQKINKKNYLIDNEIILLT